MNSRAPHISSLAELEALVGEHVMHAVPEIFWGDSHGHFQFDSEAEALQALGDPYYQKFLPDVDWSKTVIREVRVFRPYCSDAAANWKVVESAAAEAGPMIIRREGGRWHVAFGLHAEAHARTPAVAICLAALGARGISPIVNHDRIDAQLSQIHGAATLEQSPR